MVNQILAFVILVSIVSMVFAVLNFFKVLNVKPGTKKMQEISNAIHEGAMTFLDREYRILTLFVLLTAAFLIVIRKDAPLTTALTFVIGAFVSALAGNFGMRIATLANTRCTNEVRKSIGAGLKVAISSGLVMSMSVVGLGLFFITILVSVFKDPALLFSFGFGASSVALFSRVGGGIYTKAADVGADLVGKVEKGIPEDDPRNPAVIADNVGDNVGDVAGMGADLFESYVDSIIAAMVLGASGAALIKYGLNSMYYPLLLAALGAVASILGSLFVRIKKDTIYSALDKGVNASAIIMTILTFLVFGIFDDTRGIFFATFFGLLGGVAIGHMTEYFTSTKNAPTQRVAESCNTGAATNIINGLALGMISTVPPVLIIAVVIILANNVAGLFGIAIAAVGMLSILGMTLATDTYGPVADNAAGIAEMAGLGKKVRERAEALDEVGNTTAAIGKGFAIGSAALTTIALFVSYNQLTKIDMINISEPIVLVGLFLGALMPFVFSALTMSAVGRAAYSMVTEVRRQFKTIKGLMSGKGKPDYKSCIDISTKGALKEMIVPGLIAILTPIFVGFILGPRALGGLLAGTILTGFLLAVFMANSGAVWDNAKKYIEKGNLGGKGSDAHKAAVVGDTVGDPFKDTSGPSLNILIKLMTIVSLIIAPILAVIS